MDTGDRILLSGMVFYGHHGHGPEERALGQRFVVDLEVGVDLSQAGHTDDLLDTVDYGDLYQMVRDILEGESLNLLEAVASRVATRALERPRLLWARVRVSKPSVAIEGSILSSASVEIKRHRTVADSDG